MGNASSSPPPPAPPVVQEADYPGSGKPSTIIPGKPVTPRSDGVSISKSQDCDQCNLEFVPGISTSSVNLTRVFGGVRTCGKFEADLAKVRAKEIAVRDFVGGIQSGQYLRKLNEKFCEEVRFPDDIVQKISTIDELNNNISKLTSVRIREISSDGFSTDTKVIVKPSIPLKMSFNGNDFSVDTITMYHPCPLRVQDQQADAVISLNDPSSGKSPYVILIPITTGDSGTPSADFFGKIASQLSSIELPNPATGQYTATDIQTGKDWGLSNLFPIEAVKSGKANVTAGFFVWEGMPSFERYLEVDTAAVKRYGWRRRNNEKITYIMLEKPLPVSPNDLAALIRSVPVTDWTEAIHEILEPAVYKQGPSVKCDVPTREHMANSTTKWADQLYGDTAALYEQGGELSCDPFSPVNAQDKGYSTDKILTLLFNVVLAIAAAVGAYIALAAVARMYDVEYADFTKNIGKVMGVWAKNMQGKIGRISSAVSAASGGPMAALAKGGPMAALAKAETADKPAEPAALGDAEPAALGNAAATEKVNPFAAIEDAAAPASTNEIPANPITSMTNTVAPAGLPSIIAPEPTRRAVSPGVANMMKNFSSNAAVTPTGQASRGLFNVGRTMGRARLGRGRAGLTQRAVR
jgi:hypothetical protein